MPEITLDAQNDFEQLYPDFVEGRPRIISFYAGDYTDVKGNLITLAISVRVEDGDVDGILDAVTEHGGIGGADDQGVYRFIPWPCACVEIRDA